MANPTLAGRVESAAGSRRLWGTSTGTSVTLGPSAAGRPAQPGTLLTPAQPHTLTHFGGKLSLKTHYSSHL